jgi:hypothetical protein
MSDAGAPDGVVIRGTTDAADIAAVLAVLAARRAQLSPRSGYEKWRHDRLKALRSKGIGSRDRL